MTFVGQQRAKASLDQKADEGRNRWAREALREVQSVGSRRNGVRFVGGINPCCLWNACCWDIRQPAQRRLHERTGTLLCGAECPAPYQAGHEARQLFYVATKPILWHLLTENDIALKVVQEVNKFLWVSIRKFGIQLREHCRQDNDIFAR